MSEQSIVSIKNNIINKDVQDKYSTIALSNILKNANINLGESDLNELKIKLEKLNYIVTLLINIVYDGTLKNDEPFIQELTDEINKISEEKISKKQCYKMLKKIIDNKQHLDLLVTDDEQFKTVPEEYKKNFINLSKQQKGDINISKQQKGGEDEEIDEEALKNWEPSFFGKIYGWGPDAGRITKIVDVLDSIVDLAGFVPGAGILIDGIGVLISLLRGKFLDAFFSVVNIIPVIGSFIGTPGKYITKFIRYKKKYDKLMRMKAMISGDDEEEEDE